MIIQYKIIAILRQLIRLLKMKLALIEKEEATGQGFKLFAEVLGKRESGGNYRIVNSLGYLGKWQFGLARLCDLGYTRRIRQGWSNSCFTWKTGYSRQLFLSNPNLQNKIFKEHTTDLIKQIKRNFKETTITKYTLSGLVAGAHLGGIGGVRKFFMNHDVSDAYGTRVSSYIKRFKGFDLSGIA